MTTPLPILSVPRIPAVKASSGTSERKSTIESSAASRSKRNSSALGCISGGNAQLLRSAIGISREISPSFYGRARLRVSSRAIISRYTLLVKDGHEHSHQHRDGFQSKDLADFRRQGEAGRDQAHTERRAPVGILVATAALWTRGVLEHECGIAPKDMQFWMERTPSHSHRGAIGFSPPPGVTINQIPPEKNIGSMMVSGELEAAIHYIVNPNLVDRSTADLWNHPAVKPLFPDPLAEGIRYYRKTGIFPINHGMVIRKEIVEKHPWVVLNLYKAFERANEIANRERLEHAEYYCAAGLLSAGAKEALGVPLVRHGIKANRKVLETAASYSHEQGLTSRRVALEEAFAASAMEQ